MLGIDVIVIGAMAACRSRTTAWRAPSVNLSNNRCALPPRSVPLGPPGTAFPARFSRIWQLPGKLDDGDRGSVVTIRSVGPSDGVDEFADAGDLDADLVARDYVAGWRHPEADARRRPRRDDVGRLQGDPGGDVGD